MKNRLLLSLIILSGIFFRFSNFSRSIIDGKITFFNSDDDAYYHLRRIERACGDMEANSGITGKIRAAVRALSEVDRYSNYPYGYKSFWQPEFDLVFAGAGYGVEKIGEVLQFKSNAKASSTNLDMREWIYAVFPPVFGGLTVWLVYLLARKVFGREDTALFAAFIMAVLPGHISYSAFGRMDHHFLETLLSLILLLGILRIANPETKDIKKTLAEVLLFSVVLFLFFLLSSMGILILCFSFLCFLVLMCGNVGIFNGEAKALAKSAINRTATGSIDCRQKRIFQGFFLGYLLLFFFLAVYFVVNRISFRSMSFDYLSGFHLKLVLFLLYSVPAVYYGLYFIEEKRSRWAAIAGIFLFFSIFIFRLLLPAVRQAGLFIKSGLDYFAGFGEFSPLFFTEGRFSAGDFIGSGFLCVALWLIILLRNFCISRSGAVSRGDRPPWWTIHRTSGSLINPPICLSAESAETSQTATRNSINGMIIITVWVIVASALAAYRVRFYSFFSIAVCLAVSDILVLASRYLRIGKAKASPYESGDVKSSVMGGGYGEGKEGGKKKIPVWAGITVIGVIAVLFSGFYFKTLGNIFNPMPKEYFQALTWLRENSPETSGFSGGGAGPEYGVLSERSEYGNAIIYIARRPAVAVNMHNALSGLRIHREIFDSGLTPDQKIGLLRRNGIRYLIVEEGGEERELLNGMKQVFLNQKVGIYKVSV